MPRGGHNKLPEDIIQAIIRDYTTPNPDGTWNGGTTLARRYGVADTTIRKHLRKRGVRIRNNSEAIMGKACKPVTHLPPEGEDPPLCRCGCGQRVEWYQHDNHWLAYVKGHRMLENRPYFDPNWIETEYVQKQRSTPDIAQDLNVSPITFCRCMDRLGIPRRTQAESLALSGAVRGSNNPSWKGGVADWSYTFNWKAIARLIRERDDYICQLCSKDMHTTEHICHVHHIDEDKFNNSPYNLITLCHQCHMPLHNCGNLEIRPKLREMAIHNTEIAI